LRAIARSDIEMQTVLYHDGKEFRRGEASPIAQDSVDTPNGIPIFQRMTIGPDMPPGHYVLQLQLTDKRNRRNSVSQDISFTVIEN